MTVHQDQDEQDARRRWFREEILPLEPELLRYAERLVRPGQTEADDLVHDVLLKLIAYPDWRVLECPAAYARQMLRNLAIEASRKSKVVVFGLAPGEDAIGMLVDEAPDPQATAISRDELARLEKVISELPAMCRRVFTLRKVYGLSPPEIAEKLGVSVSTVEKHLTKGLRICTERLAREPVGGIRAKARSLWTRARNTDER